MSDPGDVDGLTLTSDGALTLRCHDPNWWLAPGCRRECWKKQIEAAVCLTGTDKSGKMLLAFCIQGYDKCMRKTIGGLGTWRNNEKHPNVLA